MRRSYSSLAATDAQDKSIMMDIAYQTMYRDYPDVVGVKDISKMLGISSKGVRRLVQENKLPCIPDNRTIRVAKLYVIDYVMQLTQN